MFCGSMTQSYVKVIRNRFAYYGLGILYQFPAIKKIITVKKLGFWEPRTETYLGGAKEGGGQWPRASIIKRALNVQGR